MQRGMRIYQFIPRFTEEVERDGGAQARDKTLISELKRRLDVPGDNGDAEGRRYDGYDRDLSRNGAETISSVEVCEKRDGEGEGVETDVFLSQRQRDKDLRLSAHGFRRDGPGSGLNQAGGDL
ncbi:hypothetical protein F2Q69_00054369 [Brassica cretica]|uniref:Uncharacterized protein n=1 Tax=Brassica cretica TaxID=69181 RepID=A0A8S9N8N0_BRACR|nr:hypothetical protein F2Q69_00054369 [Brassica cretica]